MIFCTYFDSAYAAKGRICIRTLLDQGAQEIYVLAFDQPSVQVARNFPNVHVISINDVEAYRPSLLSVKPSRSPKEYYATITPVFPQFIFDKVGPACVYYSDADIMFLGPVAGIESEMGNHSLMVTPHENPATKPAGLFNVGILGYRNDQNCRNFLSWWEQRCLEWCEWRYAGPGKCADQAYLDILHDSPGMFKNVRISSHPGINLGPWNISLHSLTQENGMLMIDGRPLIGYHFHGFHIDKLNNTGWDVSSNAIDWLYRPYRDLILEKL